MLKMASESFIHALLLFLGLSHNFPLGAPGNLGDTVAYASLGPCKWKEIKELLVLPY